MCPCLGRSRKLTQQRRQRQLKCHPKSEFALFKTSSLFFQLFLIYQIFPWLEFWWTVSTFIKIGKSLSCVPVHQKTWNYEVSRRTRAATAKKCTKKRGARAKLLFCQFKAMPSTSSLLKVPNILNSLGICNLLKIVWRVNKIQLLLNPRVLPLHDSQQILGIRLNAWQREISYVREWYQKEHKNWLSLDGQGSKWWVWNQALDEARKSVRQIQTYLQRLSEGISNHPNTFYCQTQKTVNTWKSSGMLIVC